MHMKEWEGKRKVERKNDGGQLPTCAERSLLWPWRPTEIIIQHKLLVLLEASFIFLVAKPYIHPAKVLRAGVQAQRVSLESGVGMPSLHVNARQVAKPNYNLCRRGRAGSLEQARSTGHAGSGFK